MVRIQYECGCWYSPTLYTNHPGTLKFNVQIPIAVQGLQLCEEHKQQVMNEIIETKEKEIRGKVLEGEKELAKYKEALKIWDKETPTAISQ